jgi:Virulence factor membrane-bound polymerase, C-terminal/O-Antigen ligase
MSTAPSEAPPSSLGSIVGLLVAVLASVCALMAWLSPNHYMPWPSFHNEFFAACAATLLGAWTLWCGRHEAARTPWLAATAILAAALPWLQWVAGLVAFAGDAWAGSLYMAGAGLAMYVGHALVRRHGAREPLAFMAAVVLIGALLSMWIALAQWQLIYYFDWMALSVSSGGRYYANFAQPNHFALFLALAIVCTGALLMQRRIGMACAALLAGFFVFGIAMTSSRGANLALVTAGCVLLASGLRLEPSERRRLFTFMAVAATLAVVASWAWPLIRNIAEPDGQPATQGLALIREAGTRGVHWRSMIEASMQRPWFGFGWYQIHAAQLAVAANYPATHEMLSQSHNQVIDLVVWLGWPLGLLLTALIVLWFVQSVRRVQGSDGMLMLALVTIVLAHSMVEFPLYYAYFMLPVALAAGGVAALTPGAASLAVPRAAVYLSFVASAALSVVVAYDYFRLETHWRAVRFEQANWRNTNPSANPPQMLVLTGLGELVRLGARAPYKPVTDEELDWIGEVARRYPHAYFLTTYAAALVEHDQPDRARQVLAPICKMHRPRVCEGVKEQWAIHARTKPKVAAVAWPGP